jgi:hypothetical protein
MAILGKPFGIFDLNDSDSCVGSFMLREDIKEILSVNDNDLNVVTFKQVDGLEIVDEREIQKLWYNNQILNSPASKIGNTRISLDELILKAIIKRVYPTATIEHQVPWRRKRLDFRITLNDQIKIIEFHGPGHFTNIGYGNPDDPFQRKKEAENEFKNECVIWPYWIQRCSSNVRAIFEDNIQGYGALWSTEIHFGSFTFNNSAEIIEKITKRFNAVDQNGYGYFYGGLTRKRNNLEHPIIDKILNGRPKLETLLPRGYTDKNYWLPDKLKI